MNQVQRMFGRTVYVHEGPAPRCPSHGFMWFGLGGWNCRKHGCHYRPGRREIREEIWTGDFDTDESES